MKKLEIFFRESPKRLIFALLTSLFWIIFLWNFWEKGIYALGFNLAIWLLLVLIFLAKCSGEKAIFQRKNFFLLSPLLLIILSYATYDNIFIKVISIPIFPIILTISLNYLFIVKRKEKFWSLGFFTRLLGRIFAPLAKLNASSKSL